MNASKESNAEKKKSKDKQFVFSARQGQTNLTLPDSKISEKTTTEDWEHLQENLLRVVSYRYYDCDAMLAHSNERYYYETASNFCIDEEELETLHLQDFVDILLSPIDVDVKHQYFPVAEQPQVVKIEDGACRRVWKWITNVCTLKTCRQR